MMKNKRKLVCFLSVICMSTTIYTAVPRAGAPRGRVCVGKGEHRVCHRAPASTSAARLSVAGGQPRGKICVPQGGGEVCYRAPVGAAGATSTAPAVAGRHQRRKICVGQGSARICYRRAGATAPSPASATPATTAAIGGVAPVAGKRPRRKKCVGSECVRTVTGGSGASTTSTSGQVTTVSAPAVTAPPVVERVVESLPPSYEQATSSDDPIERAIKSKKSDEVSKILTTYAPKPQHRELTRQLLDQAKKQAGDEAALKNIEEMLK